MDFLNEAIQFGDEFRRNALDRFGPFAPTVTMVGQGMAASYAVITAVFGKSLFAPPVDSKFSARVAGAMIFLGVAVLYVWSKNGGNALHFLMIAVAAIAVGVPGALFYKDRLNTLCITCPPDPAIYIRGRKLNANATKLLKGDYAGLPEAYQAKPPPLSEHAMFCNGGKMDASFVWEQDSINRAKLCLVAAYLIFAVPIALGVASAATALAQPELHVDGKEILLGGDVLFDYKKWDLRPGAAVTLDAAAAVMRQRGATTARIEGHTDERGTVAGNLTLSMNRAETVQKALAGRPGLDKVKFTPAGLGSSQPVVPKAVTESDHAKNRRVTILLDR
jgi:outer membrane protein OmpA-like peptidoglycan-associated protein